MTPMRRIASAPTCLLALLLPVAAAAQTESIVGHLPVAGSTQGDQGSNFKTSLRILNPNATPIAGRIVFHPAGRSGDPTDPSIDYALAPEQSRSLDDVAAAIGVTGLGSLDVTVELPVPPVFRSPVFVARIFSDAGTAGTTGFTMPLFVPGTSLSNPAPPVLGYLIAPVDSGRFRYNVGVLNVGAQVDLTAEVLDSSGAVLHTVTHTYPANFFEQSTAAGFTGGFALESGQSIRISPASATVIVYGATVDNVTNDSSAQFLSYWFQRGYP